MIQVTEYRVDTGEHGPVTIKPAGREGSYFLTQHDMTIIVTPLMLREILQCAEGLAKEWTENAQAERPSGAREDAR